MCISFWNEVGWLSFLLEIAQHVTRMMHLLQRKLERIRLHISIHDCQNTCHAEDNESSELSRLDVKTTTRLITATNISF